MCALHLSSATTSVSSAGRVRLVRLEFYFFTENCTNSPAAGSSDSYSTNTLPVVRNGLISVWIRTSNLRISTAVRMRTKDIRSYIYLNRSAIADNGSHAVKKSGYRRSAVTVIVTMELAQHKTRNQRQHC